LVWSFLEEIVEVSTNTHEQDVPASPELIDHVDRSKPKADGTPGDGVPPPGMVPALRVTFVEKVPDEKDGKPQPFEVRSRVDKDPGNPLLGKIVGIVPADDSFLKRQTAEYEASFGFVILWSEFQTFYTAVGTVKKAKRNMMDFVISVLSGLLQTYCLAEAMLLKDEIEAEVRKQLEAFCEKAWGIKVTFFRIKPFSFSHDFNTALSLAAAANEKAKETIRTSEGFMTKTINEGKGTADAELRLLNARAEGFRKMADIAKTPEGQFMMANDAARAIAKASTVIVPDGNIFGGVLGVANVIHKNFQQSAPPAITTPATTPTAPQTAQSSTQQPPKADGKESGAGSKVATTNNPSADRPREKKTWKGRKK